MCQSSGRRFGSVVHDPCDCSCSCQATMTVAEEIQLLVDLMKSMQDQLGEIDKKMAALKTTKET
jgi:hypothetical protein